MLLSPGRDVVKLSWMVWFADKHPTIEKNLRDLGSYSLVKAQAYAYSSDLDKGVDYALRGLQLASEYQSKRHIARVDAMYHRLSVTPLGQDKSMGTIREALSEVHKKQELW